VGVYLTRGETGVVLGFPTSDDDPGLRATAICRTVLQGDAAAWPVVYRH